jgi:peptidyl-prolyl cis-trans isomerase SurA
MKQLLLLPLAALLALPAAAEVQVLEEIIAKINGEIITRSEMERNLAEFKAELARQKVAGVQAEQAIAQHQKDALRDLIDTSLLVQRGKELNISVDAAVIKRLDDLRRQYNIPSMEEFEKFVTEKGGMHYEDLKDQIRNQLLTERVIQQEVGHKISISKEEIAKYYEEHKQEFIRPEEVHLRQILISTEGKDPKEIPALEKKANEILARLKKGERFPEVASKVSDDKESAEAGGDIGFWKRGVLDKPIEDLVFNAKRGFITDVIKRPNGFLILRVEERHTAGQATLQDVEQEIQERLYIPKMQPALRAYLTQLRANAFIEIRPGYVDSGAAPGKDTAWKDPENFKPAVTTKAEATKKKKRMLGVVPRLGGKSKAQGESAPSASPAPADKPPAQPRPAAP